MNQTTRLAVCLGMMAGSLAIATAAHADIPVTGGRATGDAAFFCPVLPHPPAPLFCLTPRSERSELLHQTGRPPILDSFPMPLVFPTPTATKFPISAMQEYCLERCQVLRSLPMVVLFFSGNTDNS